MSSSAASSNGACSGAGSSCRVEQVRERVTRGAPRLVRRPEPLERRRRARRPCTAATAPRRARPRRGRRRRQRRLAPRRVAPASSATPAGVAAKTKACTRCSRPATYRCEPSARTTRTASSTRVAATETALIAPSSLRRPLQPEERLDAPRGCATPRSPSWPCAPPRPGPRRPRASSTRRLASVCENCSADLRALLEDALQGRPCRGGSTRTSVTRDDVGRPRLAGHQAHLAEEARAPRSSPRALASVAALDVPADLDLARGEHVEPVRHGALPGAVSPA